MFAELLVNVLPRFGLLIAMLRAILTVMGLGWPAHFIVRFILSRVHVCIADGHVTFAEHLQHS